MWKSDKGCQSGIELAGKQWRRASPGLVGNDRWESLADSAETDWKYTAAIAAPTDTDYV